MKKIINAIIILILPTLIIIGIGVFLFVTGVYKSLLFTAQKTSDFPTNTNYTAWSERGDMKMAKFSVDFLVHLENADGKYIAIYPYTVCAGFDFRDIVFQEGKIIVPEIKIYNPEPQKANVIRNGKNNAYGKGVFSENDEEKMLLPVKAAFAKKIIDFAIDDGNGENSNIIDRAKESTRKFFSKVLTDKSTTIKFAETSQKTEVLSANYMNVNFKVGTGNFQKYTFYALERDDSYYEIMDSAGNGTKKYIDIGLMSGTKTSLHDGNINEIGKKAIKYLVGENSENNENKKVAFYYRDPFSPNEKVIISDASDGFTNAIAVMKDGTTVYFKIYNRISGQSLQDDIAPSVLYLAMSAVEGKAERSEYVNNYKNFVQYYDNVSPKLSKIYLDENKTDLERFYDKTIQSDINKMWEWSFSDDSSFSKWTQTTANDLFELSMLDEIIRTGDSEILSIIDEKIDNEEIDFDAALKYRFVKDGYALTWLNSQVDKDTLEILLDWYSDNDNLRCLLEAYCLAFNDSRYDREFEKREIEEFVQDMLDFGYFSKSALYADTLKTLVNLCDLYEFDVHDEESDDVFVLFDDTYDNFYAKKNKGFHYITERIEKNSRKSDYRKAEKRIFLVFSYKGKVAIYNALADLRKDGLYFFEGFDNTGPGTNKAPVFVKYEDLEIRDKYIRFGGKSFEVQPKSLLSFFDYLNWMATQDAESAKKVFMNKLMWRLIEQKIIDMYRPYYEF